MYRMYVYTCACLPACLRYLPARRHVGHTYLPVCHSNVTHPCVAVFPDTGHKTVWASGCVVWFCPGAHSRLLNGSDARRAVMGHAGLCLLVLMACCCMLNAMKAQSM